MASIQDVFDELEKVNHNLVGPKPQFPNVKDSVDDVKESVDDVKESVDDVKESVDDVKDVLKKDVVTALNTIATIDSKAVELLFHLTEQADTMICALEHISKNTCGILTQVTIQTQLQTRLLDDADALRYIAESAYPQAALERQRLADLRAEIERCCPPEKPKPACSYEPCPAPKPVGMPDLPKLPDLPKPDDETPK